MAAIDITRRQLAALAVGTAAQPTTRPATLRLGLNLADTLTLDPARQSNYSPPLTLAACYDRLVTYVPGNYTGVVPHLATAWARTPDERGWRFTLRPDVTFASGAPVTPDDWVFSLERVLSVGDLPAQFLDAVAAVVASGPDTVDILLKTPDAPILGILAAPDFGVLEQRAILARNPAGVTEWLNQTSAGTGPYVLAGWTRNRSIELVANPRSWRGPPGYQRVSLVHLPDPPAQERALRRGEIDAAFNLIPEQIAALQSEPSLRIERVTGLDFVYLALNGDPTLNPALAKPEARQAIGWAIDYDEILGRMLGGQAVRPASFLPIGVRGSTVAVAREIGVHQDLARARDLLAQAGLPDGFTFELAYGTGAIAGLDYATLARKLRSDLARVGIRATLAPLEPQSLRTRFIGGRSPATLAFWNQPVVDTALWADAAIRRVARRVGAEPDPALAALAAAAAAEPDGSRQSAMWIDVQKALVARAHLLVLFQPTYQVAVRRTAQVLPLTGAGWMADLGDAKPASSPI